MAKKIFILLIGLILISLITSCPETVDKESNDSNAVTYTLSGDIIAGFSVDIPTNTVTIKLLPEDDPLSTALYSTTTSSWRSIKAPYLTRYAAYYITHISPGTYYLYAVISPASGVMTNTVYGPASITISAVKVQDIDFTL